MVDTVKLSTGSFCLKETNRFQTSVTTDSSGAVVAERSFCNLPHFSADITSDRLLYVQTSLPKLIYRTSLYEVQPSDFGQVVEKVQAKLSEAGVQVADNQLGDFQLSRLDLCRNLEVDHSVMDYLVYLSDRYMPRRQKRDIDHETLSFRNSDRELTFYNKVREIRNTEKDLKILRLVQNRPENIVNIGPGFLRLETREGDQADPVAEGRAMISGLGFNAAIEAVVEAEVPLPSLC